MSPSVPTLIRFLIVEPLELKFRAALIYFVSSGRYWARLIYAVLLGVQTVNFIRHAPAAWQHHLQVPLFIAATIFMGEYMAMYWLFTEPGRRWFKS
jgi:hypothetical protein